MCNLYDLDVAAPFIKERFRLRRIGYDDAARAAGLVRPSDMAPVVHLDAEGEPVCSLMEWGFVRQWKNEAGKLSLHRLFNVRSETIDTKPTFAPAYRKTRAIIPVSGYYELPEKGVRIRITRGNGDLLAFAGLWEEAVHPRTGESITAFTMAMTDNNPFTAIYHPRMPCLLADSGFDAWLDPRCTDAKSLLMPYAADDLVAERSVAQALVETPRKSRKPKAPVIVPMGNDLFD
ncbi:MAG: SOS response-associated peptidase [Betaproteobacteria bacterium]